jgi:twinkle protein
MTTERQIDTSILERVHNSATLLTIDDAVDRLAAIHQDGYQRGTSTGFEDLDAFYRVAPYGQLNIITGTPGSGKSEIVDSIAIHRAREHNERIFVYSPENYPAEYHLQKMCEKFCNKPFAGTWGDGHRGNLRIVESADIERFRVFLRDHFCIVDCHINTATIDQVMNSIFMECLLQRVHMAIVDPWNKIEHNLQPGETETKAIGRALTRCQMFSRERGIQFWIVAHPKKMQRLKDGTWPRVTPYDIDGSANWYNMADNIFIASRDWNDKTGTQNVADLTIAKIKDRRHGKCGEIKLLFNPATGNYSRHSGEML